LFLVFVYSQAASYWKATDTCPPVHTPIVAGNDVNCSSHQRTTLILFKKAIYSEQSGKRRELVLVGKSPQPELL